MSEQADAFRRLARVVEAVEAEGGVVEDVDVTMRESGGLSSAMYSLMIGRTPREPVFDLRVRATGVELDDEDESEQEPEPEQAAEILLDDEDEAEADEVDA